MVEASEFNYDDDEFSVTQYSYGEKNVFVFTAEKNDLFLTAKGFSKKSYNSYNKIFGDKTKISAILRI